LAILAGKKVIAFRAIRVYGAPDGVLLTLFGKMIETLHRNTASLSAVVTVDESG